VKKPTLTVKQAEKINGLAHSFWDETTNHLKGFAGGYSSTYFMTLEQVAKEMKVSRERVRQIETRAIRKLQHPKRSVFLKPFLTDHFDLESLLKKKFEKIYE